MMEWIETTLGEMFPFKYGKNLPAAKRSHAGEFDVVTSAGIVDSHSESLVDEPSIVIGRKGTVGSLTFCPAPCWPTDTAFYTTGSDATDLRFGYYFLHTLPLAEMNNDSAVPGLNRTEAEALPIRIPQLTAQVRIGEVLGSIDDKIAANQRAITTAEELMNAVVLEKVRKGRMSTIGAELVLNYGKSLPAKNRAPGEIPVLGSGGIVGSHSAPLVENPTIVVGRKGTIGALHWLNGPSFPIDTTFWVETKRLPIRILYWLLKLVDFSSANTDSAVPGLNRSVAYEMPLPFLSDKDAAEIEPTVENLDLIGTQLQSENLTLTKTRDELLPLLMSGKISVTEAGEEAIAAGVRALDEESEA